MTHRERQSAGGVVEAVPRPAAGPLADSAGLLWEDLYRTASPEQQRELLALAGRQGLLYAHQLPQPTNGAAPTTADRGKPFLVRLLAGQAADLSPSRTSPLTFFDAALDEHQREAVARALHTPDVCLIQGLPGTGKSRVVAEIVAQAAARGERILLAAPHAAALDRVLTMTSGRDVVCPVRCLAAGERPEFLPPASRAATLAERSRRLTEHTLPQAHNQVVLLEKRCLARPGEEVVWGRLLELAAERQEIDRRGEGLERSRAGLADEMARLAADPAAATGEFAAALSAHLRARDEARQHSEKAQADLAAQLQALRTERDAAAGELDSLRPLADAREHNRWWTGTFWKAKFKGDINALKAELESRRQKAEEQVPLLEKQFQQLRETHDRETQRADAEHARLIEGETARRRAALDAELADCEKERASWQRRWDAALAQLLPETPHPAAPSSAAVAEAREAWEQQRRQDEERLAVARQWAACLDEVAASFPGRLVGLANLVATPFNALAADPNFGDAVSPPVVFDLLVIDAAEAVTEAELNALARRARRWVLVGHAPLPTPHVEDRSPPPSPAPRGRAPARRPASAGLRPAPFQKLWQTLHTDPRELPSTWVQEKDGLFCRLRAVTAEESQHLESEHLADRPDVELRILAVPRREPVLAEIVFPPTTSIAEAKEYIFKELEQLAVTAPGRGLRWQEHPDRLVLRLADDEVQEALPVALAPGVRERVFPQPGGIAGSKTWATCCIEFDRSAGWQREHAEEWVQRHLGLRDFGRTALLDVPHRMKPELAALLSDWLFAGAYRSRCDLDQSGPAAVEFISVPPQRDGRAADRGGAHPSRSRGGTSTIARAQAASPPRRGGAGYELDLTDVRGRERLPADLRAGLPESGFVNLPEAQAVVRAVESLVTDPGLHAAARRDGVVGPAVGVVALYPGQGELIRRLLQRSSVVGGSGLEVKVDVPAGFRDQECLVVVVSLTRSHTHRAVTYGDGPQSLALALTRARSLLLVVGDPGTLVRRTQWETPLDHLDETASARERAVVVGLVEYLRGQESQPQAFSVREGSGA
jgi:hypothetical protein